MSNDYVSTSQFHSMGSKFQLLSGYIVVEFLLIFFISLGVSNSIQNIARTASTVSEAVDSLVSSLRFMIISVTILSTIEIIILSMIIAHLYQLRDNNELNISTLESSVKLFVGAVIVLVIGSIIGLIEVNQFLNYLQANSGSVEQLGKAIDQAQSRTVLVGLLKLVGNITFAFGFFQLQPYFSALARTYSSPVFDEAGDKVGTIRNGFLFFIIQDFISLFPNETISGLFGLIGIIFVVIGYYQTGSRLSELPNQLPIDNKRKQSYGFSTKSKINDQDQISPEDSQCSFCGELVGEDYSYCISCGTSLK